jgi:GxxExxY protein
MECTENKSGPMELESLTGQIIHCAIEVHKVLGPGLLESAYEECLMFELLKSGIRVERQVPIPVIYKEIRLEFGYRINLLVSGEVLVELKSIEALALVHEAQILTYMKFAHIKTGLLINFNVPLLKKGLKRYVL